MVLSDGSRLWWDRPPLPPKQKPIPHSVWNRTCAAEAPFILPQSTSVRVLKTRGGNTSPWGQWGPGPAVQRAVGLPPLEMPKAVDGALGYRSWPCPWQEVGQGVPLSSLPTQTSLGFCDKTTEEIHKPRKRLLSSAIARIQTIPKMGIFWTTFAVLVATSSGFISWFQKLGAQKAKQSVTSPDSCAVPTVRCAAPSN